jgi:peptidoglycan/xylan/chitin deacetylase (PgdA/CDA1 family)
MAQTNQRVVMSHANGTCVMTTSWDDGHPFDLRIADLLAKWGVAGTFYVPRTSQRPVINGSQIRDLSASFEIGAHTLDHVPIDRLSDADAAAQLSGSREWIEELTGKTCGIFCFPGGKFRRHQLNIVRRSGFRAARTVELLSVARPLRVSGIYVIPTTIQAFPHSLGVYAKNVVKRLSAAHIVNLPAALLSKGWRFLAEEMLSRAIESGAVFHLWGHSWEIEEQSQWKNLEALLKTMSSYRVRSQSITNGELCGLPSETLPQQPSEARTGCAEGTT